MTHRAPKAEKLIGAIMGASLQRPIPSLEPQPITLEQYLEFTSEKLELIAGYLIDSPERADERVNLLALLLRNVGLEAAVHLAPTEAWDAALRALREAPDSPLGRVRSICLALPEVEERLSHGSPTFFVRKKSLVSYEQDHHGDGRLALWCAATHEAQQMLVETNADQFFLPSYVAHLGWVGVRLDRDPDWDEVAEVIESAYRKVAPKGLVAQLDAADPGQTGRS